MMRTDSITADGIAMDVIRYQPDHKDTKGNPAPWVIISEKTGKVIWSGTSKTEAEKSLGRMKAFSK